MSSGYPSNHQELFVAFLNAERTVIGEYSSSIAQENEELAEWAAEYAAKYNLTLGE